jgi:hypothetical protein
MSAGARSGDRRAALAVAGLVFGLGAPLTYLLARFWERARDGIADASMILSEPHVGFYRRVAVAAWFGGLLAALAFGLLRRRGGVAFRPERVWSLALIAVTTTLFVLLAWLFP